MCLYAILLKKSLGEFLEAEKYLVECIEQSTGRFAIHIQKYLLKFSVFLKKFPGNPHWRINFPAPARTRHGAMTIALKNVPLTKCSFDQMSSFLITIQYFSIKCSFDVMSVCPNVFWAKPHSLKVFRPNPITFGRKYIWSKGHLGKNFFYKKSVMDLNGMYSINTFSTKHLYLYFSL